MVSRTQCQQHSRNTGNIPIQATVQTMGEKKKKKAMLLCNCYAPVYRKVSEMCVLNTEMNF